MHGFKLLWNGKTSAPVKLHAFLMNLVFLIPGFFVGSSRSRLTTTYSFLERRREKISSNLGWEEICLPASMSTCCQRALYPLQELR
ncbi:unnamed protein product [Allacma fusca]|uniref:Uncharacterized protein n=1 Tax=Allacma fusca TaxID=39272 RepID=A0A8J2PK68_9HEXA|nr:unnamed protein product [Allacma fusca]